jgi:hypothetical protein
MRVVDEEGKKGWSWKREVTGHFGNMSPGMRGEFASFLLLWFSSSNGGLRMFDLLTCC